MNVAPALDLSKVKVQGLNNSKWGLWAAEGRGSEERAGEILLGNVFVPVLAQRAEEHRRTAMIPPLPFSPPPTEVDVGRDQEFAVNTKGAGGQGKVDVKISSPSRRPIPCKVETGATNDIRSVKYMPPEEGPYKVDISYDGHPVPGSPFTVEAVMPPDPSKVSAQPST